MITLEVSVDIAPVELGVAAPVIEGTKNYEKLTHKPQINTVELRGNQSSAQLGITPQNIGAVDENCEITNEEILQIFNS
ncbi:MAG: hypothetical protein RSB47_02665 [Ruthenibacterium sp.]